jgi:hypothetical protein
VSCHRGWLAVVSWRPVLDKLVDVIECYPVRNWNPKRPCDDVLLSPDLREKGADRDY